MDKLIIFFDLKNKFAKNKAMRVSIHILLLSKTIALDVSNDMLVLELKKRIKEQEFLPVSYQRLFSAGCEMMDAISLAEYKLVDGSRIDLLVKLDDGSLFVEFPNGNDYCFTYNGSLELLCEQIDRIEPDLPMDYSLFCGFRHLTLLTYKELFGNHSSSFLRNQDQGFLTFSPTKPFWIEFPYKIDFPNLEDTANLEAQSVDSPKPKPRKESRNRRRTSQRPLN